MYRVIELAIGDNKENLGPWTAIDYIHTVYHVKIYRFLKYKIHAWFFAAWRKSRKTEFYPFLTTTAAKIP